MVLTHEPKYEKEGIFYVHDGSIYEGSNLVHAGGKYDEFRWETFSDVEEQSQMFLSSSILNIIFHDILLENDLKHSKKLNTKRQIQQHGLNEIIFAFDAHLSTNFKNIKLQQQKGKIIGNLTLHNEAKTKEGKIFLDVESDFTFEIIPEFVSSQLNLKFSELAFVRGQKNLDEYNLYKDELFQSWIQSIFNSKVGNTKVFSEPFEFYYKMNGMRILDNQGIVIKGLNNFPI